MTKNIDYIEKQYREHIKSMPVEEFKIYQTMLILNLYDSFIEHDERKALKSKEQIEELTEIYEEEYNNVFNHEMKKRLNIANRKLIEQLEENKQLSIYYLDMIHDEHRDLIRLSNQILKALLLYYESNEGKETKKLIKDIFEMTKDSIQFISFYIKLLYKEDLVPYVPEDNYPIHNLIEEYGEFKRISKKIKQL